eukprot:EG_transcript_21417
MARGGGPLPAAGRPAGAGKELYPRPLWGLPTAHAWSAAWPRPQRAASASPMAPLTQRGHPSQGAATAGTGATPVQLWLCFALLAMAAVRQFWRRPPLREGLLWAAVPYSGQSNTTAEGPDPCVVLVRDVPVGTSWQLLKDIFRLAGEIRSVAVDETQGRAVARFAEPEGAEAALRTLQDYPLRGCHLRLERPEWTPRPWPAETAERSKAVAVANLPPATTWRRLKDHCQAVGNVDSAEVFAGGQGVVYFATAEEAEKALAALPLLPLKGHTLAAEWAVPRRTAGPGPGPGPQWS